MSVRATGKFGWLGSFVAKSVAISGVVLAVATILFVVSGRGFFEGCGGEAQVWYELRIDTLLASLVLVPVALLVLCLVDRARGMISLVCSAGSFALLFFAPHGSC